MPITKRKCRVCGKEYEACRTNKKDVGGFSWKEVACSPECGAEYLRLVQEARNPALKAKQKRTSKAKEVRHEEPVTVPVSADAEAVVGEAPLEETTEE